MNMDSTNVHNQNFSFTHCSAASSPFSAPHLFSSREDQSHLGSLLNSSIVGDHSGQTLDASLPMQFHYPVELHNFPQLPTNISNANRANQASSALYPLGQYVTSFPQQNSFEPLTFNSLQNASYALSLTLPGSASDKNLTNVHLGVNIAQGIPIDPSAPTMAKQAEKSCAENGKDTSGVRRRARRQRPFRTFGERSSQYRGVSRYRYTGRYEAFLWDNTDPEGKAKTVYVGVFDEEQEAARAYDLAALKFWGRCTPTNFPISDYENDLEEMQNMTKKEYLLSIRRKSKCFSKGASIYRGVSRNTDYTKWQARVGRGHGLRGIYLGTFDTEEEAARAYDIALIRFKGMKAVTNFDLSHYDVRSILKSNTLPIGKGASRLLKRTSVNDVISRRRRGMDSSSVMGYPQNEGSNSSFHAHTPPDATDINNINNLYNNSYGEIWKVESAPTDPQNANSQFYNQICNIDTTNQGNQALGQYQSQDQKRETNNSTMLHEMPKFDADKTIEITNETPTNKGLLPDKKHSQMETDDGNSKFGFWKGIEEFQPFGQFQTFQGTEEQKFQGYQMQSPDFQMNPSLLLGLGSVGSGGMETNSDGNPYSGRFNGEFTGNVISEKDSTTIETGCNSSRGGDFWAFSETQQGQPFDQFQYQTRDQNLQFHQSIKDPNPFLHQNPSGSLSNFAFGGSFSLPSDGILAGNPSMVDGTQGTTNYNLALRNGLPVINGTGAGESSSARANFEGAGLGVDGFGSFGSEDANILNSPSAWLESFFKDADPPSFIL